MECGRSQQEIIDRMGSGQTALESTSNAKRGVLGNTAGMDAADPIWQHESLVRTL